MDQEDTPKNLAKVERKLTEMVCTLQQHKTGRGEMAMVLVDLVANMAGTMIKTEEMRACYKMPTKEARMDNLLEKMVTETPLIDSKTAEVGEGMEMRGIMLALREIETESHGDLGEEKTGTGTLQAQIVMGSRVRGKKERITSDWTQEKADISESLLLVHCQ